MVVLENTLERCSLQYHSSSPDQLIAQCTNVMHEVDRLLVYKNEFAMCKKHYCAILKNIADGTHNTISCSGLILRWSDVDKHRTFNAVSNRDFHFDKMIPLPYGFVEKLPFTFKEYFYVKDSRSVFEKDVFDLKCTNNLKTCYSTYVNGTKTEECLGNLNDDLIIDDDLSFAGGILLATVLLIFFFIFKNVLLYYNKHIIILTTAIPLIAFTLFLNSIFLMSYGSFILGWITVLLTLPLFSITYNYCINLKQKQAAWTLLKH